MIHHPVLRVLHRTLDVLERAGVECAVMGGFAVSERLETARRESGRF